MHTKLSRVLSKMVLKLRQIHVEQKKKQCVEMSYRLILFNYGRQESAQTRTLTNIRNLLLSIKRDETQYREHREQRF